MTKRFKNIVFTLFSLFISVSSFCQPEKQILKSWIKKDIYLLPENSRMEDTSYLRYAFQKGKVFISFYPAWNENQETWKMTGNKLRIGIATYTIDTLTDSTLIISIPGFRRYVLYDENYLNQMTETPSKIGEFENEPVYEANHLVTPRYNKGNLYKLITSNLEEKGYNVREAATFIASMIIKKDGSVDNIQIIKSIYEGYDTEAIKQLKKTNKEWTPAFYKGEPIQTQITLKIRYLNPPVL